MTKEQCQRIKLDYEKGLAEWEEDVRWEETIIEQETGIIVDRDDNELPF